MLNSHRTIVLCKTPLNLYIRPFSRCHGPLIYPVSPFISLHLLPPSFKRQSLVELQIASTITQLVSSMYGTQSTADSPKPDKMLAAADNMKQLSEANLAKLESMQQVSRCDIRDGVQSDSTKQPDNRFGEYHIRQEGMELCDRAHHAFIRSQETAETFTGNEEPVGAESIVVASSNIMTTIESVARQYPVTAPSSASVLERFAFVSPQTESFNLHATHALKSCQIDEGSLEHVILRAEAARRVTAFKRPAESDSTKAVTSDADSDSDNECLQTLVVDSDKDCGSEDNVLGVPRAIDRSMAKGRTRRKRVPRLLRREAHETADKRRIVE